VHAMGAYVGHRGIVPLILNLSDGGEWSTSCSGSAPGKETRYPLNVGLDFKNTLEIKPVIRYVSPCRLEALYGGRGLE
jgi:hypothetical protein